MTPQPEKPKWSFIPTISFDGIAMISMAVLASVWFGTLKEVVRQHDEAIKHIENIQQTQGEALKVITQNIAVLTTIVNERLAHKSP